MVSDTDVLNHLNLNWNALITPRPDFMLFNKLVGVKRGSGTYFGWNIMGGSYITVRLDRKEETLVDITGRLVNEYGFLTIMSSSSESGDRRDLMREEIMRIMTLVMTGYNFNYLSNEFNTDQSDRWSTTFNVITYKFCKIRGT